MPARSDHEEVGSQRGRGVGDDGHDVAVTRECGVAAMPASRARSAAASAMCSGPSSSSTSRIAGPAPARPAGRCGRTESTSQCRPGLAGEVDRDVERLACRLAAVGGDEDGLHRLLLSLPPDVVPGVPAQHRAHGGVPPSGSARTPATAFPNVRTPFGFAANRSRADTDGTPAETGQRGECGAGIRSPPREISHYGRNLMRRWLQYGGFAAGVVLIVFGVVAIAMGANGRSTVRDNLRQEQIVGSPDMTPAAIKAEAGKAGLKGRLVPDLQRGRRDRGHRCRSALLRELHAHPRARGQRRPDLQPDGALRHDGRQGHE